jgi:mannitol 2-dehydrogenase
MAEILPYVSAVPGMTPKAYLTLIERRFANPAIRDTTRRVAFDGSSRHAGFVLPILRDAIAAGGPVEGLALVEALWARMCAGKREDGSVIAANDPNWDALSATAQQTKDNPRLWLEKATIYVDVPNYMPFVTAFDSWLRLIWTEGTAVAIAKFTSTGG